jgi:hypothetical protein
MAVPLTLANYAKINADMNALLTSGKFIAVKLTAYTDATGSNVATVDNLLISHLEVANISCTLAHVDAKTGNTVNGNISVTFRNDAKIIVEDTVDNYWYTLEGVPFVPKAFGNSSD